MSGMQESQAQLVDEMVARAASWTGYRVESVERSSIERVLQRYLESGVSMGTLLDEAARGAAPFRHAVLEAACVGETYLFRHPEHFELLAERVLPRMFERRDVVRAWCAGCATGEEAYSLAACLVANCPPSATHMDDAALRTDAPSRRVDVLGTDLLERSINAARSGEHGRWSRRDSGPLLYPSFFSVHEERVRVDPRIREVVSFEPHNLLDPPPGGEGGFDIVFCRNVLIYFAEESLRKASANLISALSPGGVIVFGTLDVGATPPGLVRVGPVSMNVFQRPEARRTAPPPRAPSRAATARPPPHVRAPAPAPPTGRCGPRSGEAGDVPSREPEDPVALHLRIIGLLERHRLRDAERLLDHLRGLAPDYLPGVFECALIYGTRGDRARGLACMREVLRRIDLLPLDTVVAGPVDLPATYYRVAAEAYLGDGMEGTSE